MSPDVHRHPRGWSILWFSIGILVCASSSAAEQLIFNVQTPEYQIIADDDFDHIEMEGYGDLLIPGKPSLPVKRYLIALPPGMRVLSVDIKGIAACPVAGRFHIEPAPPIMPVSGTDHFHELRQQMQQQWQSSYDATYLSNEVYPGDRGALAGAGTLRKYAYASVAFYPFDYHPQSGELVLFSGARITVEYKPAIPGSPTAVQSAQLAGDTVADLRAQQLFSNFEQARQWYSTSGSSRSQKREISDYVIITTGDLRPAIEASDFLSWKASLGFTVRTVLVSDSEIADQPGSDLAQKIRNFLRSQYGPWGIEYVLIVGDLTAVPMRYCYPNPANHTNDAGTPNAYAGEVPTDFYYADLSLPDADSWDLDGDGFYGEWGEDLPDLLTEVYVGRIPTGDPGRVTYTLDKLTRFEQDTGAWKTRALQAGAFAWFENEDFSGREMKDLATYLNLIEVDLLDGWDITHFSEQAGLVPSIYPWSPLNTSAFAANWCFGQFGLVNWGGHGWPDGVWGKYWAWDDGDGVPESQNPNEITQYQFFGTSYTMDDDYPSIVFTLSCLVGYPEDNAFGNLGIDMLTNPGIGPAAGIVSGTRVVWVSQGGGELHCYEFNHHLINGPNVPGTLLLHQNYPNPFNPRTTISYDLSSPAEVTIRVFDLAGRLVRVLQNAVFQVQGRHEIVWNGCNDLGRQVGSGTYFCRLEISGNMETGRMLLVR